MTPLRWSPSATITPTPAGVLLRSDLRVFQITGADLGTFLSRLSPLLDGTRDRAAVQAALSDYSPASVAAFLDLLAERGLIEEAGDEPGRGQIDFLRRWPGAPADAMDRIAGARVLVAGGEPWGEAAAVELRAAGVGTVDRHGGGTVDGEWSLVVGAVSAEDADGVETLAREAHRAGVRTLWSLLGGGRAVLGPLTVPGRTACGVCAAADAFGPPLGARPAPGPRTETTARLLGHLVALEVLKVVTGYTRSTLGGRVLIQDLTTFETRLHTLVRLPWCRACGRGGSEGR
jgi:molybdopterin-synthase adenylyltransferase